MTTVPGALGLSPAQVADVLRAAGRAPSLHNSQPWLFRVTDDVIELHADPDRRLPATDPHDRELRLACGAALFNLRIAVHGFGFRPRVTVLPDHDRPGLVALVHRGAAAPPSPEQLRLLRAIPQRRSNRHPFSDVRVSAAEQTELCRAAAEEGGRLHIIEHRGQRAQMQRIAAEAHRVQLADPLVQAETERWTGVAPDRSDGVPLPAGGPLPEPQDRWVLRDFTAGSGRVRAPGKDFEQEPLIAVLTTSLPGPAGDVQAGQALQHVLLTATADGLAVSLLSHVVEVPQARAELGRLVGDSRPPQAGLRIGRGWPVPATRRRDVADLLLT
ncbi:Acg family FMN-binding oxidoreductase [Pseudonocardia sp. CA-142604]|uniref:Acg family FMN-binding oxidoreductase n=1 Tax=Pseudonocardia sp. CA-142604 TaxID=3240024 RepID=UPI003D907B59